MNISATTIVNRPANEVFEFVMDVPHDAQWRTGVVEAAFTSDNPPGVGTTGFDRVQANGREMVAEWTVFDFVDGQRARWTLDSGPIKGTGGYVCEELPSGTQFTLEADVKPSGWYRLLGPIFGMIGRRQNHADVQRLKAILEKAT